jgi:hypothetical protein
MVDAKIKADTLSEAPMQKLRIVPTETGQRLYLDDSEIRDVTSYEVGFGNSTMLQATFKVVLAEVETCKYADS